MGAFRTRGREVKSHWLRAPVEIGESRLSSSKRARNERLIIALDFLALFTSQQRSRELDTLYRISAALIVLEWTRALARADWRTPRDAISRKSGKPALAGVSRRGIMGARSSHASVDA